jgi:hypothetical protein
VQLTSCPTVCVVGLNKSTKNLSLVDIRSGRDPYTKLLGGRAKKQKRKRKASKNDSDNHRKLPAYDIRRYIYVSGSQLHIPAALSSVPTGQATVWAAGLVWTLSVTGVEPFIHSVHVLVTIPTGISRLRAGSHSGTGVVSYSGCTWFESDWGFLLVSSGSPGKSSHDVT